MGELQVGHSSNAARDCNRDRSKMSTETALCCSSAVISPFRHSTSKESPWDCSAGTERYLEMKKVPIRYWLLVATSRTYDWVHNCRSDL